MSNREIQVEAQVSGLHGVNERMEPTLLDNQFVSNSKNVYFNIDGVASRIEGKRLSGVLEGTVLHMHQFGERVLVQTLATLQMLTVEELVNGEIAYGVSSVEPPTIDDVTEDSMNVTIPALPTNATGMDLYWSDDGTVYVLLEAGVTAAEVIAVTGLDSETTYYFKIRAFNGFSEVYSLPASAETDAPAGLFFTYVSDGDANGLFYYYGTNYGAGAWANPFTAGRLGIGGTAPNTGGDLRASIVDRVASSFSSSPVAGANIRFDLGSTRKLRVTAYTYRYRNDSTTFAPTAWTLQGSNNDSTWAVISTVTGQTSALSKWVTTLVPSEAVFYRFIRFVQTGNNNSGQPHLSAGEIELYGELEVTPPPPFVGARTYASSGDANGVFYYVGTAFGISPWVNPVALLSATGTAGNTGGDIRDTVFDRVASNFSTSNTANAYVQVDLGANLNLVVNYLSYRFRNDTATFCPTSIKLQGSNDGSAWTDVITVAGMTPVASGWSDTAIIGQVTAYRYWRLSQVGLNNSGFNFFSLGEWELYGTLTQIP